MSTVTVPSAAMHRLRRQLEISRNRSKAPLAPTGGVVAKKRSPPPPSKSKSSSPAPRCNPEHTAPPVPLPPRRAGGDAGPEELARRTRTRMRTPTTSTSSLSRSRHGAAPQAEIIKGKCIGKRAQVRVRTRVGTVCTGQHLVLWLRAVVVESAADGDADGCLRVAYDYTNGKFPRVARVSPNDVKLHVVPPADASGGTAAASTTGSSTTTSDRSARNSSWSSSQQGKAAPPPRPTVAGKKLPLLKKLEKEMLLSSSKAIIGCL